MSCCSSSGEDKFCASRMNDGRMFTDYRPKCMANNDMMSNLNDKNIVVSSYESRMYLQQNAEKIMQEQKNIALDKVRCTRPHEDVGTMLPERYTVKCDNVSCQRAESNPSGLGDGRNFF